MKQISDIYLKRTRNAEHFQFHADVLAVITASTAQSHHLEALRATYAALFARENDAFIQSRGYEATKTVEEQDALRDNLFVYLRRSIENEQLSPVPARQAAARKLDFVLKPYRTADQLPYAENTAQVSNLVADLQNPLNAPHVATLGLTEAVALLKTANNDFNAIYSGRSGEKLDRASTNKMKTVRPQVDAAYVALVSALNALYQVNELTTRTPSVATALGGVIDGVNSLIIQLQETLVRRGATGSVTRPGTDGETPNPTLPGDGDGETPDPPVNPGGGGETPDPDPLG